MWFHRKKVIQAMLIYARGILDSKTEVVELVQASKGIDRKEFLSLYVVGPVEMQISNSLL